MCTKRTTVVLPKKKEEKAVGCRQSKVCSDYCKRLEVGMSQKHGQKTKTVHLYQEYQNSGNKTEPSSRHISTAYSTGILRQLIRSPRSVRSRGDRRKLANEKVAVIITPSRPVAAREPALPS